MNIGSLQGDIGESMHRHSGCHLNPEAGIAGNRKKALRGGSQIGRKLGLQRVDENEGSKANRHDEPSVLAQGRAWGAFRAAAQHGQEL